MSFFEMTFPPLWKNKNNFSLTGVNKKDPLNEINGITIKSISPRLVLCSRESLAGKESWKRRSEGEGGGEKWHAGRQWETERGHPMNPGIRQFHHACSRSDLPPGTFILPSIREIVATRGSSRLHVSDSFVCRRVIVNVASRASQPASPVPGKGNERRISKVAVFLEFSFNGSISRKFLQIPSLFLIYFSPRSEPSIIRTIGGTRNI